MAQNHANGSRVLLVAHVVILDVDLLADLHGVGNRHGLVVGLLIGRHVRSTLGEDLRGLVDDERPVLAVLVGDDERIGRDRLHRPHCRHRRLRHRGRGILGVALDPGHQQRRCNKCEQPFHGSSSASPAGPARAEILRCDAVSRNRSAHASGRQRPNETLPRSDRPPRFSSPNSPETPGAPSAFGTPVYCTSKAANTHFAAAYSTPARAW